MSLHVRLQRETLWYSESKEGPLSSITECTGPMDCVCVCACVCVCVCVRVT